MTTSELKTLIHESIININDEQFLESIYALLATKYKTAAEPTLSEYQKQRLTESIGQAKRGEYRTSEAVFEDIEKWLNK